VKLTGEATIFAKIDLPHGRKKPEAQGGGGIRPNSGHAEFAC
jgi:hypothetical protein